MEEGAREASSPETFAEDQIMEGLDVSFSRTQGTHAPVRMDIDNQAPPMQMRRHHTSEEQPKIVVCSCPYLLFWD